MDYLSKAKGAALPANFAPPEAWPEFGALMMPQPISRRREWVGANPRGMRWGVWPLIVEEYVSDQEPNMAVSARGALAYNRIIFWKRITRTDVPKGWHYTLSKKSWRIDAYCELAPDTNYTASWHKKARHDLATWQGYAASGYCVEEVTFAEFKEAYLHSTVYKKQGSFLIDMLERKLALPETKANLVLWAVRNKSGRIIAGTAAHYSSQYKSSIRECPFILPEARECQASSGLMDHWFAQSQKRGATLLLFTYFWQPGDPKSWRGFSTFKSHFATGYVHYPPVLWRFARGKFW